MALTREQRSVLATFLDEAEDERASPREVKALVEAGLVESNLRDLPYGDRDSVGPLQQRPSQGWGPPSESVAKDAEQFLDAAQKINRGGFKGSAGQLAQAVQRSAFPARYDQRGEQAESLIRQMAGGLDLRGKNGSSRGSTGSGGDGGGGSLVELVSQRAPFDPGTGPAIAMPEPESRRLAPVSAPQLPEFAAKLALPEGYQPPQGTTPQPEQDSLSAQLAVLMQGQSLPDMPAPEALVKPGDGGARPSSGAGGRKQPHGLVPAVQSFDAIAADLGVPITAKQEPGHATGGDHDPAVKGATARDYGGGEAARRRLFDRITRELGVDDAEYKGPDINITRDGIRYQIISRDHGSGPHLHVGLRKVSR